MMVRTLQRIFLPLLVLFLAGCAQQGSPTGGPRDEEPPDVVEAAPANYSTQFDDNRIEITFDEFLDMGNFAQELVVSPPMEEKPVISLRKRTLIIEFEEELRDNTTYTFNFGTGIKDLNEQNVLLNFEYVFSTGDYLDSLSVKGTLRNAFDLTIPGEQVSVMLYENLSDSIPIKQIPLYIGRTDTEGNFAVNNLRPGVYKVFALNDANSNFLFDLPNESIAYLDSSLRVDAGYFKRILLESGAYDSSDFEPDTIPVITDTTGVDMDSLQHVIDSLESLKPDPNSVFIDLFMFTEESESQYLGDYNREEREFLDMQFNLPVTDSFLFRPMYPPGLTPGDFIPEYGMNRDSLRLWARDTVVASRDTIQLLLNYTMKDSMNRFVTATDTADFIFREPKKKKSDKEEKEEENLLKVSTTRNRGKQHLHKPVYFTFNRPVASVDTSTFQLYTRPDTTDLPLSREPEVPGDHLRRAVLNVDWEEGMEYRMVALPGTFRDIYGNTHDTLDVRFTTRELSDYGKVIVNLSGAEDTLLIQLMQNEQVKRQQQAVSDGTYEFEFVDPSTYRVKFIHDRNLNGKWDTGDYLEGRQPERVEYLPVEIEVRANWDHDVDYTIGSHTGTPHSGEEEEQERGR